MTPQLHLVLPWWDTVLIGAPAGEGGRNGEREEELEYV